MTLTRWYSGIRDLRKLCCPVLWQQSQPRQGGSSLPMNIVSGSWTSWKGFAKRCILLSICFTKTIMKAAYFIRGLIIGNCFAPCHALCLQAVAHRYAHIPRLLRSCQSTVGACLNGFYGAHAMHVVAPITHAAFPRKHSCRVGAERLPANEQCTSSRRHTKFVLSTQVKD